LARLFLIKKIVIKYLLKTFIWFK